MSIKRASKLEGYEEDQSIFFAVQLSEFYGNEEDLMYEVMKTGIPAVKNWLTFNGAKREHTITLAEEAVAHIKGMLELSGLDVKEEADKAIMSPTGSLVSCVGVTFFTTGLVIAFQTILERLKRSKAGEEERQRKIASWQAADEEVRRKITLRAYMVANWIESSVNSSKGVLLT